MVTNLCRHLTHDSREHGIQCMPCFSRIISEMLPEIHTMKECEFLKNYDFFSYNLTPCYKILRKEIVNPSQMRAFLSKSIKHTVKR